MIFDKNMSKLDDKEICSGLTEPEHIKKYIACIGYLMNFGGDIIMLFDKVSVLG